VRDGAFGNWESNENQHWWISEKGHNFQGCVQRQWVPDSQLASVMRLELMKLENNHYTFQDNLESDHGSVHCAVSGHMCLPGLSRVNGRVLSGIAPYDIIFFAHHATIDRVWHDRQSQHAHHLHADNSRRVGHDRLLGFRKRGSGEAYRTADVADNSQLKVNDDDANVWAVNYAKPERLARVVSRTSLQGIVSNRIQSTSSIGMRMSMSAADIPIQEKPPASTVEEALCMIAYLGARNSGFRDEITPCCPPHDLKGRLEFKKKQLAIYQREAQVIEEEIQTLGGNAPQNVLDSMRKAFDLARYEVADFERAIDEMDAEYEAALRHYDNLSKAKGPWNSVDATICLDSQELVDLYLATCEDPTACLPHGRNGTHKQFLPRVR